MDPQQADRFLMRPSEVAARLSVSRTWVYNAAQSGRIPSIRIGGQDGPLRFIPEDVDSWLQEARGRWRPGRGPVATRSIVAGGSLRAAS